MSIPNPQRFSIHLHGAISELEDLALALHNIAETLHLSDTLENQLNLILEELYANSVNYAFSNVAEPMVSVELSVMDDTLHIAYRDNGPAFNPLDKQAPNLDLSVEDRPIGGLGIFFVKSLTDEVTYRYADGLNQILMMKRLSA